jgi:hypothetical protein
MFGIVAQVRADRLLGIGTRVRVLAIEEDGAGVLVAGRSKRGRMIVRLKQGRRLENYRAVWVRPELRPDWPELFETREQALQAVRGAMAAAARTAGTRALPGPEVGPRTEMDTMRATLLKVMREALQGRNLLVERNTPPDRYPTLRVSYEGGDRWSAALGGRPGMSYRGTENEAFLPVELLPERVDWGPAIQVAEDGSQIIDSEREREIASEAQAAHIATHLERWADEVVATLRQRGVLA